MFKIFFVLFFAIFLYYLFSASFFLFKWSNRHHVWTTTIPNTGFEAYRLSHSKKLTVCQREVPFPTHRQTNIVHQRYLTRFTSSDVLSTSIIANQSPLKRGHDCKKVGSSLSTLVFGIRHRRCSPSSWYQLEIFETSSHPETNLRCLMYRINIYRLSGRKKIKVVAEISRSTKFVYVRRLVEYLWISE